MARRSNVPKFGDWESEGNVPYTVYFDKARKNRGTEKPINPNDPAQFMQPAVPRPDAARPNRPADHGRARPNADGGRSNHEQPRANNEPSGHGRVRPRGDNVDASPLHRNMQGRVAAGGHNGAPLTPNRARPNRGLRSVEEPDDYSSAVPKFGGWENNPESGENYTERFNNVLRERQAGPGVGTNLGGNKPRPDGNKPVKKKGCSCFSWF